ncbi:nicotinamide n-methyltransferase [Loxospora ochrophaea]|nr:nicotinamide n-methyltransferase [Loxospora ochrophaea]
MSSPSSSLSAGSLFQEPPDYFPPEKPATFVTHTLLSGETLQLRLVGHNPLWGHCLWNGGQVVSEYLQHRAESLVRDKNVLELGAGAGLPSLVCAIDGAKKVVVTDYPDEDLIENLRYNIENCRVGGMSGANISAEGYVWGAENPESWSSGFDILILADLLFNHSEQGKLVLAVQRNLRRGPSSKALVFFTPYTPWRLEKDLAFFDLAREGGFRVEKVVEKQMDKLMFKDDRGDETLRRTVFGYELTWDQSQ